LYSLFFLLLNDNGRKQEKIFKKKNLSFSSNKENSRCQNEEQKVIKNKKERRKEKKNRNIGLNINRTKMKVGGVIVLFTLFEFKRTSNQFSIFIITKS